jgi:type II secretory pathway predicted ATPase ExeA
MNPDRKLLAFYGLKYNPFLPAIPSPDIWTVPGADSFMTRIEDLVMDGGFGLLTGESGLGKSKLLHRLAARLGQIEGVAAGIIEHPTSALGDFYRELGALFGVGLSVANRYGSFTALRDRWRQHIKNSLFRPVLLVDEAQDAASNTLNELRILGSERFDSENLLTVVLCGDTRLLDRFRKPDLLALGSRIRTRLALQPLARDHLAEFLDHLLDRAGAPQLCSPGLKELLVDHSAGNPRMLCGLAADLLDAALRREKPVLDEALYFDVFDRTPKKTARKPGARA